MKACATCSVALCATSTTVQYKCNTSTVAVMASTDWDPEQYAKFETLRSRPFWDLAKVIDQTQSVQSIVHDLHDTGCFFAKGIGARFTGAHHCGREQRGLVIQIAGSGHDEGRKRAGLRWSGERKGVE